MTVCRVVRFAALSTQAFGVSLLIRISFLSHMKKIISAVIFLCSLFIGCTSSLTSPPSPEVLAKQNEIRVRQDFANKADEKCPFRVVISAQGKDRTILDIGVIEEVAPYAASGTVELLVSEEMKRDAKALGFTEIQVEGGRKSFGDPDTINKTIYLR